METTISGLGSVVKGYCPQKREITWQGKGKITRTSAYLGAAKDVFIACCRFLRRFGLHQGTFFHLRTADL